MLTQAQQAIDLSRTVAVNFLAQGMFKDLEQAKKRRKELQKDLLT